MNRFSEVVIKNGTEHPKNIHLLVHPFRLDGNLFMMHHRGDYRESDTYRPEGLPASFSPLADKLWDELPGLNTLFFGNGEITIQHYGIFSDELIVEAATEIVKPFLEENLRLTTMFGERSAQ